MDDDIIFSGLADFRYEELKAKVADLFEQCNVCCLPINSFEIAARMNYHVIPYAAWPDKREKLLARQKDAFSLEYNNEQYIILNDEKTFERQNWTIMHEIAHRYLNHREQSIVAEREADFFAKYALLPPPLINKLKLTSPDDIQRYFIASREAAINGMNYYQKWLRHHTSDTFTTTEERILRLFSAA